MNIHHSTLWQLIETLIEYPSLSPEKIRQVLPVEFSERRRTAHFSFYDGGRLSLSDQIDIENVNLRVRLKDETEGLIILDLAPDGACVTREQVFAYYPDSTVTGTPRGDSLDEKTYWGIQGPWGRLSFGFKERNRQCAASIVINRIDPVPTSTAYQYRPK